MALTNHADSTGAICIDYGLRSTYVRAGALSDACEYQRDADDEYINTHTETESSCDIAQRRALAKRFFACVIGVHLAIAD